MARCPVGIGFYLTKQFSDQGWFDFFGGESGAFDTAEEGAYGPAPPGCFDYKTEPGTR